MITAFDAKPIRDPRDLALAVAQAPVGARMCVELVRDRKRLTQTVTIQRQDPQKMAALD